MKKFWWLYAVSVLILGCANTMQAPALHDFGLNNSMPSHYPQLPASAGINVVAPKWLNDVRIHYRLLYDQPTRVRFYNLDLWIAPAPDLLKLHLESKRLDPNYSLLIHLFNFEQQFETPGDTSVLLRFSAEVSAASSKKRLGVKEFVLRSGKVSPDAQGAVIGFAELAEQAAEQIRAWLENLADA